MRTFAVALLLLALAGCASPAPAPESPGACEQLDLELQPRVKDTTETRSVYNLVATNTSDAACVVAGRPTAEVLGADGAVLASSKPTDAERAIPVNLAPGASAYVLVELIAGTADCDAADTEGLRVTLPGADDGTVLTVPALRFCAAADGGDALTAGAFTPEPLESHEVRPGT